MALKKIREGIAAPDFSAKNENGKIVSLSDYSGKWLVLYFYPKDNTPTCTKEACSLRDDFTKLKKKKFTVLGVSADSEKSHLGFIQKFNLPFSLLSDPDKKIIKAYGVWGKKKLYGREYMGIIRKTIIISPEGIIKYIIDKVDSSDHANQVLNLFS